jgi:hypothetical protein
VNTGEKFPVILACSREKRLFWSTPEHCILCKSQPLREIFLLEPKHGVLSLPNWCGRRKSLNSSYL